MFTISDFNFNAQEGAYKILENTDTNEMVSVICLTENNKAVVFLKIGNTLSQPVKVAEFENPTDKQKERFFTNQFNFWLRDMIERYNIINLSEFLESPIDLSFEYYANTEMPGIAPITISSENGMVYFMADDKVKVLLGNVEKLNVYNLEMYIKKAFMDYLIKLTEIL